MNKEDFEKRLKVEEEKVKQANELRKRLDAYPFGIFDPRYRKTRRELTKVIKSFAPLYNL